MFLAHVFASVGFGDNPGHVIRNRDDFKFSAMTIGLALQFFNYLNQALVVPWNQHAALVEAWLLGTGS